MATTHYDEPQQMMDVQEHINTAFSALFAVEALIKIFGEPRQRAAAVACGCCSCCQGATMTVQAARD